jgi:hypothetical protein
VSWIQVTNVAELTEALASEATGIEINGTLKGMPSLTLPPGMSLRGGTLEFGAKGLQLTRNNSVEDVTITTSVQEVALYNDTSVADLGILSLKNVTTTGQIYLAADGNVRSGHVSADTVHVAAADTRGRFDRPAGFGVEALQGAFTLWNRQADSSVRLTARLENISAGSKDAPVRGGGVFVGGHGDHSGMADGGTIDVELLSTGHVFSDGGIAPGTPDVISGGVFVISGANVAEVRNLGTTTTYGQNDVVLDNWGQVTAWTADSAVSSHGPSGIGFVNFGDIGTLTVNAPITTHGLGARGFNVYDGSLNEAVFESITTFGDGSVGVQVSRELPVLTVRGNLATSGGTGESLVKGVLMPLSAIALSIKPSGRIGTASIGGNLSTAGDGVVTVELEGSIEALQVAGKILASGAGSDGVRTVAALTPVLEDLTIEAPNGQTVVQI